MPKREFRGQRGAQSQQRAQTQQEAQTSGANKPYTCHQGARFALLMVLLLCLGVGVWLYARHDPATSPLAPKCPFRMITGYDCPACGNQRSLHALRNGDLVGDLRFNPFLYLSLPYLGALIYATISHSPRARRWHRVVCSPRAVYTYLALLIIWWIIRNTPLWPY